MTADQIRTWIALAGAIVAIAALIWSVQANTRQLRAARATALRQELFKAKSAALDTFELVRAGAPLFHIATGIVEELEQGLGKNPQPAEFVAILTNKAKRSRIISTGWFRQPLAEELHEVRGRLIDSQRDLTGELRIVPLCNELIIKAMENTHSTYAFGRLFDVIPSQLADGDAQTAVNAGTTKALDWLAEFVTDISWQLFFGIAAAQSGEATADAPSDYAIIFHTRSLIEQTVNTLAALSDNQLINCAKNRDLESSPTYTEDIERHLKALPLDDKTRVNLVTHLDKVKAALIKPTA